MSDTTLDAPPPADDAPAPVDELDDAVIAPTGSDADRPVEQGTTASARERAWRRALGVGLVAFVVSRLCVLAGAAVRASQVTVDAREEGEPEESAIDLITGVLVQWDGRWYVELVERGYPTDIPADITYNQIEARAAFFPMYPGAVNVVDSVLPGGSTLAAIALNIVLGAISVVLVGMLARRVFDERVAARSMVLYSIFPGSFVLSFAYSEALFIVFAASCLLLLLDEQWLLAGLAAALATATRPNGVAIVLACAVAAAIAIKRDREWKSLVAVLLAPVGFVAFQWYIDDTAGESGAWFRVQREAWSEGTSFGVTAVENTFGFLTSPFDSPADALTALSLLALAIMVYCAWKRRLPLPWVAFSAVIVALMLIPETVTARPRFVFTAFPLFIAVAAWWPDSHGQPDDLADPNGLRPLVARYAWDGLLVLCGAGLVALTMLYAVFGAIP